MSDNGERKWERTIKGGRRKGKGRREERNKRRNEEVEERKLMSTFVVFSYQFSDRLG